MIVTGVSSRLENSPEEQKCQLEFQRNDVPKVEVQVGSALERSESG